MALSAVDVAIGYLLSALSHPVGIGVVVTDMARARSQLTSGKIALSKRGIDVSCLTVRTSPVDPACHLWIMKTAAPDAALAPNT